ncbi:MAG: response regulator [Campylobacterota bacterium]|nr:response regulator [Campylobacterota bacterium]
MQNIKILVVEDEQIVSFEIESALESLGFGTIRSGKNYEEAILMTKKLKPDVVIMDINLEKSQKDGIDTIHDIKVLLPNIHVIYLTAFSDDDTLDRAMETNPCAYLIKPFKREELKTTIKIALNNNKQKNTNIPNTLKELGDGFYFDIEKQLLYKNDIPIKLSKNEKSLLTFLLDARGNIVSFEDIERNVWSDRVVANSTVRSLIHRLRCKLNPKLIKNHLGIGCQLQFLH